MSEPRKGRGGNRFDLRRLLCFPITPFVIGLGIGKVSIVYESVILDFKQYAQESQVAAVTAVKNVAQYLYDNYGGTTTTAESPAIPHSIYMTYKQNVLESHEPPHIYQNIMNTIAEYRRLWNEPEAPVHFLTDDECRERIEEAEPRLVQHFDQESSGTYKADICRVAALYLEGGYYFDIDLRVVVPVSLDPNITFASCREKPVFFNCQGKCPPEHVIEATKRQIGAHPFGINNLFQAFIASSKGSPVLKKALYLMIDYYEKRYQTHGPMGVSTLGDALAEVKASNASAVNARLLQEAKNTPNMKENYYPDVEQPDSKGIGCKNIVHDPGEHKVYFFSRVPGFSGSCVFGNSTENPDAAFNDGKIAVAKP